MASTRGATRTSAAGLAAFVRRYVGYRDVLDPRSVHHGLPSAEATVIIAFDEPLDSGWLATPDRSDRFWTLAAGLHPAPALIRTHGFQHGIQLQLTPLGVRALLGVPPAELGTSQVSHDQLPLGIDPCTHARLADLPSWPERFDLLDRTLLATLGDRDPAAAVRPEVAQAWSLLRRSRGRAPVAAVARAVGWSRRQLSAQFGLEYGIGPKQAAQLMRFDHAKALLRQGHSLSDTAAIAGYADQPHLTRSWRTLAGTTPTEFLQPPYRVPVPESSRPSRPAAAIVSA